jgi:hypothetical protein
MVGMLLSEAIRLGAMLGPQVKDYFVVENGGSCALGAAIRALGLKPQFGYAELLRVFPALRQSLVQSIVQCNDRLGWTRQQIADWIIDNDLDCESAVESSSEQEPAPIRVQELHALPAG